MMLRPEQNRDLASHVAQAAIHDEDLPEPIRNALMRTAVGLMQSADRIEAAATEADALLARVRGAG